MTDEEKNIRAIIESGEVEMYSIDWFKLQGKLGAIKSWNISKKQKKQRTQKQSQSRWGHLLSQ